MSYKNSKIIITVIILTIFLLILYYYPDNNTQSVFPIIQNFSNTRLEPSGLTLFNDRLLFVSDNDKDRAIYELVPGKNFYRAKKHINLNLKNISGNDMKYELDLEGIVSVDNKLYCVDERNRFVYRIGRDKSFNYVPSDIISYNRNKGIKYSKNSNDGFEGIAYDNDSSTFFIANEKKDAIVYMLKLKEKILVTQGHFSMSLLTGEKKIDISDLYFTDGFLYVLYRRENKIIKINPYRKIILGSLSYKKYTDGLYKLDRKRGMAEGLLVTKDRIYLLLDSDRKRMIGEDVGMDGVVVLIGREGGF